jgi:hypothetical protein
MRGQLTLTDDTMRAIMALLPTSPICGELLRARDRHQLGHLTTGDVRTIWRALDAALRDDHTVTASSAVARAAVREGAADLRAQLSAVDVDTLDALGYHRVRVAVETPVSVPGSTCRR